MTRRQAALTAGFAMLLMTAVVPAEFFIFPKLVMPHDMAQTAANIVAHRTLFLAGVFDYFLNFICDIVIAWALYILFVPVNRELSLLAAIFQLVYVAVAVAAWMNAVTAFRLLTTPDYLTLFGTGPLYAQLRLLLSSWRSEFSVSLLLFSCHLVLIGYLIWRSDFVPRIIGILLAIDGIAWIVTSLQPYFYPNVGLGLLFPIYFFEWVFMLWLLIAGWKLNGSPAASPRLSPPTAIR